MEIDVLKVDGSLSGRKIKMPDHVFGIEPNEHAVYLAIKVLRANMRQGTVATKGRSQVSGGGRKPWKQKGRGAARAGSTRSPVWVGGGRVFGPQPRDYSMSLSKRVRRLAKLSVYSDKVRGNQIKLVEDFDLPSRKTRDMQSLLNSLNVQGERILLLLAKEDPNIVLASRNIPSFEVRVAATESSYDLLGCKSLILQEGAVNVLSGVYQK